MEYPILGYSGGHMGLELRRTIELITGFIIVAYIWMPFISFARQIEFWELSIWAMLWYLARLVFAFYATWLIVDMYAERDQILWTSIKNRKR